MIANDGRDITYRGGPSSLWRSEIKRVVEQDSNGRLYVWTPTGTRMRLRGKSSYATLNAIMDRYRTSAPWCASAAPAFR